MKNALSSLLSSLCLLMWTPIALIAQSGSLDATFNSTGYVVTPVNNLDATEKILIQPDQKVLMIGTSWDAAYVSKAHVFRYLPDGTIDLSFATNGVYTYELNFEANLNSAVLTPDGKIVLVGSTTDYLTYEILMIQLNADGTPDETFGVDGIVTQSVSLVVANAEDIAYDVTLDADNNILVCGSSFDENYVRRPIVSRFTPNGVLDPTFGVNGTASIPVMAVGSNSFQGIAVQPDGKIVASGYFGNTELWYVMLLVRFDADGNLDPTFGDAGIVKHNYNNIDDEADDLLLMPDGSILIAGISTEQNYNYNALLSKFTPNGELDLTFGTNGFVVEDQNSFDFASNVSLLADGKIVIAGSSGDGPPNSFDLAVWRYFANGTTDTGFGNNGLVQHMIPSYYTMIKAMEVQDDGKILVGGQARTTSNQNHFFIARLENELSIGVSEHLELGSVSVFPNPSTVGSSITLGVPAGIDANAQIDLYSADGRSIATYSTQEIERSALGLTLELPKNLAPGIYKISFQQNGERVTSGIVINN